MQDIFDGIKVDEDQFRQLVANMARQLEDSAHLVYQLLLALPGSFILLSIQGTVLSVSPRMANVFLQRDDAVGLDYQQLSFPVFKDCAADVLICDLIRSTIEDGLNMKMYF